MLRYLIPRIALADLPSMFAFAGVGAIISSVYGMAHDHVTFSIGPEYFTKVKFEQFKYADFGLGDRFFVSTIGVLATWWVGFFVAWFLARRHIPNQSLKIARHKILAGVVIVFTCAVLAALTGYFYGVWCGPDTDYSIWFPLIQEFKITDTYSFVRVAYIHNASYAGGFIGFIIALIAIKPARQKAAA